MGKPLPDSIRSRCFQAVLTLGECDTDRVVSLVGRYVTAAMAANSERVIRNYEKGRPDRQPLRPTGRRPANRREATVRGRKRVVSLALGRLCRDGKIRRVGVGRYAPLLPKVYRPPEVG